MPEQYKPNGDGTNGAGRNGGGDGSNGTGNGHYRTFTGSGFGTLMLRMATGPRETPPPVASSRAYLRNGLPALY